MFTADQSHLRLDQYLTEKLPDLSRSKIQNLIKLGQVKIDGKAVKPSLILQGDEKIEFIFEPEPRGEELAAEPMDLDIIY